MHRPRGCETFAPDLGKTRGQILGEDGLQFPAALSLGEEQLDSTAIWQQVYGELLTLRTVVGDLQNGRPAQATMGEENIFPEARSVEAHGRIHGEAAQLSERLLLRWAERQRHQ